MAKRKTITQLSDLTPDHANANKGTERGRYMVEASLTETGAGRSIVADKDGRIIAGNKTLEAWAGMGGAVKVVETDGQELVVVQRTDLDLSDPKGKARKLAYYDNRAGQVGLEWDAEQLLADVNAGVDLAAMFKADEIAELLAGAGGQGDADAEPQIDQAEELNKKWQVKAGDLWRIGAHRLLCGDSTKAADVARVMGGEGAAVCLTDPPYGLDEKKNSGKNDYSGYTDSRENLVALAAGWLPIARDLSRVVVFSPGVTNAWIYPQADWVMCWFYGGGQLRSSWGFNCWQPFLCYGKDPSLAAGKGGRPDAVDMNTPANAQDIDHPCPKPLKLWDWFIERLSFSAGDVFYEPFAGSGTTLVACENLGRKCRAVEISPAYCAVILERMAQAFPKLEITRDDGAG